MELIISDQKAISKIVSTFRRVPKTPVERIRIYEYCNGCDIARVDFKRVAQKQHGEHKCCVYMYIDKGINLMVFWNCSTRKKVEFQI